MKKTTLLPGLIIFFLTACHPGGKSGGDKYAAIFQKHDARINDIRKFLSGLKNSLPDAGIKIITVGNLSPVLSLGDNDTSGNTLILQYHLLSSPESFTSYDSLFGLYYNPLAADAFKWTGLTKERMIFERDYLKDEEVDKILTTLSADRFPWLLIVKATHFETLQQESDSTFNGGDATASYYLFDLRSKKQLSSITLSASPDKEMLYAYRSKDGAAGKNEEAKRKAKEMMQKNMRTKVYEWLKGISNNNSVVPAY